MKRTIGCILFLVGLALSQSVYQAEDAVLTEGAVKATSGSVTYVQMKEGSLSFNVNVSEDGFYAISVNYMQNYGGPKTQNLVVNGVAAGSLNFPVAKNFTLTEVASKVKLHAGANTIDITKSWGWVDIDYLSIAPFVATPFNLSWQLATPAPSPNAEKLFHFLMEKFQKKTISGVMSGEVLQNNQSLDFLSLPEVAWIRAASGKNPALLGLDFIHGTGQSSTTNPWHQAYNAATLELAESIWNQGGIPTYSWHWKDPSGDVENFYTSEMKSANSSFNLDDAFTDASRTKWNTTSDAYKWIIRDLDIVAGYLKQLADQDVPVLWRPLHEASGAWFWWGAYGPNATKMLWKLMFDRYVNQHKLKNLIWVWTSDEASDAQDWYPGDEYVDIVGRDFYYYPREANHASLTSSFETVKNLFEGKKMVALTENGSIPDPDSMIADGATWSWFMPWYGAYVMDDVAYEGTYYKDNTKEFWNKVMNHDFVLTLDEMPGWKNYVSSTGSSGVTAGALSLRFSSGHLMLSAASSAPVQVTLHRLDGRLLQQIHSGPLQTGSHDFRLQNLPQGIYLVRAAQAGQLISRTIVIH